MSENDDSSSLRSLVGSTSTGITQSQWATDNSLRNPGSVIIFFSRLEGQQVNPLAKIDSVSTYNQRNQVSFHIEALV